MCRTSSIFTMGVVCRTSSMAFTTLPPAASPDRKAALLLALLLLLLDGAAAAPPTAPGDVKALCDLYFATGGAHWTVNKGFNTCKPDGTASSDPCEGPSGDWSLSQINCDTSGQSSWVSQL